MGVMKGAAELSTTLSTFRLISYLKHAFIIFTLSLPFSDHVWLPMDRTLYLIYIKLLNINIIFHISFYVNFRFLR